MNVHVVFHQHSRLLVFESDFYTECVIQHSPSDCLLVLVEVIAKHNFDFFK